MTDEERIKMALRRLNDACISMDYECDCKYNCDEDCFIRMSREALEKQIPNKPTVDFKCPIYEHEISHVVSGTDDEDREECLLLYNYCLNCGQAIDWREENDGTRSN